MKVKKVCFITKRECRPLKECPLYFKKSKLCFGKATEVGHAN